MPVAYHQTQTSNDIASPWMYLLLMASTCHDIDWEQPSVLRQRVMRGNLCGKFSPTRPLVILIRIPPKCPSCVRHAPHMNPPPHSSTLLTVWKAYSVTPKVTVLKSTATRKRRTFLSKTNSSGKNALGTHDTAQNLYVGGGDIAIGQIPYGYVKPSQQNFGRDFKGDKGAIADKYAKQVLKDRRDAARDRLIWSLITPWSPVFMRRVYIVACRDAVYKNH